MTDPIDTEAERRKHHKVRHPLGRCLCGCFWPCPTLALLDEIDRLNADALPPWHTRDEDGNVLRVEPFTAFDDWRRTTRIAALHPVDPS